MNRIDRIDRDELDRLAWRLADRSAPEVARMRAFALVVAGLDAQPPQAVPTAA